MTTLIDDGLVENCSVDPVSIIDFDQFNVIDVDNIDVIIEDPGYILDELPNTYNHNEEYSSSYKKRSSILPVTFFDISRNIRLLKKCRPISIKIVDCDIYPWYYKISKHIKNKSDVSNKGDDSNLYKFKYDVIDFTSSTRCDKRVEDTDSTIVSHENNFTSEQRAVTLKLNEEINSEAYKKDVNKNIVDVSETNMGSLKNQENLVISNENTTECRFDRIIEPHDLLTYEDIARTIFRNIEYNKLNNKIDILNFIQDINTNNKRGNVEKLDGYETKRKKVYRESISTSPILPYSVRRQKKIKPKEKTIEKSPIVKSILEKCSDSNKKCDKFMSSINQVIPHYHCKLPVSANGINNNVYFTTKVANHSHFQEPITKDSLLHNYPLINKRGGFTGTNSIPIDKCQRKSTNGIRETTYHGLDNISFVNSSHVINNQFTESNDPKFYSIISNKQLHDTNLLVYRKDFHETPRYPVQNKVKKGNNFHNITRPLAKQVTKENFRVSQSGNVTNDFNGNCIPTSMCLLNDNINHSPAEILFPETAGNISNIVKSNPLLSHHLNCNSHNDYCQSTINQLVQLSPRPVVGMTPCPLTGPPPPPSSFRSKRFTQGKNIQYLYSEMHLQRFPNIEDPNLFQLKTNSNLNSYPKESNNDFIDLKKNPINSTKISVPPKIDSIKCNISGDSEMQNINQVSFGSCEITNPKLLFNNTDLNDKNIVSIEAPKTVPIKISRKVKSKTNCYSPPILPIPTFKKSLEMLSEKQQPPVDLGRNENIETNVNLCNMSEQKQNQELRYEVRKRKLNNHEKTFNNSKRISLQEYKLRRSENVITIM